MGALPSNFDDVNEPRILAVSAHRMVQQIVDNVYHDPDMFPALNDCSWETDWRKLTSWLKKRDMLDISLHSFNFTNADHAWNTLLHRVVGGKKQVEAKRYAVRDDYGLGGRGLGGHGRGHRRKKKRHKRGGKDSPSAKPAEYDDQVAPASPSAMKSIDEDEFSPYSEEEDDEPMNSSEDDRPLSSGDEYDGPTELRHVQNNNPMILWTLRFLLMKKANPNIMNLRGDTPLMTAIRNGHGGDVVASLLESKAYVNYRRRDYPAKLLDDEVEVLKTKLLKTAQKNTVITAKQTAARGLNEVDLIAELQEQEVVVQDDLDRAVREVEMMVDELKDIAGNGKAGAGNDGAGGAGPSRGLVSFVPGNLEYSSALTLAVRSGADAEVIMTLLMQKRPASPNVNCADAEDRLKRTPLHYLCRRKDLALVSVFLQSRCTQGCDPNLPDGLGQTPIYVAIDQRHTEMIKLLGDATTQIMTFKEEIPKLIRNRSHENHVLAAFPQLPRFATLKDRRGRRIQRDPTQVRVDAFDKFGISPLQHAILKRWGEGVRTILQYWPSISFQTGLPLKSAVRLRDVNDVYARQQIVSHLRLVGCDMFPAPDARMATDDQYLRELLTLKDENERAKKVAAGQGKAVQLLMMQVPGHEAAMEAVETRAEGGDGGDGAADGRSSPKKKKKRRQEEKAELEQLAAKAEDPINYYVRRYYNDAGSDENSITFSVRQRDAVLLQVLVPYAASVDQLTAGLFVPNINAECCRILLEAKADPDGEMKQHDAFVADYLEHSAKWYAYPQSSCLRDAETAPTASGRDIHEQMLLAKKGRKSSRWEAGQRPGEADTEAIAENPRGGEENAMGTDTPEQVSEVGDTALVVATPTSPKGTTASGAKGGKNTASKLAVVPQDLGHGGVVNRALLRSLGPHEIISRKNPPPGVSAATVADNTLTLAMHDRNLLCVPIAAEAVTKASMETNYDAAAEEASMRWQNPVMNPSGPVINPGSTSVVELLKRADAQAPGTGRGIPAGVGASMPRRKGEPPRGLPASYFSGAHPNAQGNTKSKATGAVDEGVATFLLEQERALHERRTPAMLACTMGNNAVLEVLQQYGANVSEAIETPSGWSTHIYGARTNALEDIHLGRLTSSA